MSSLFKAIGEVVRGERTHRHTSDPKMPARSGDLVLLLYFLQVYGTLMVHYTLERYTAIGELMLYLTSSDKTYLNEMSPSC